MLYCDRCASKGCTAASTDGLAAGCPTFDGVHAKALAAYGDEDRALAVTSHVATRDGYGWATRVEETMLFAARSGFRTIGVAFCITLAKEARVFCDVLRDNGFSVESVLCKTGALPRDLLGEPMVADIKPGMSAALCNPAGQALLLNRAGTDLNVVLGLCVGHDALFFKHSDAPCTCLAVKDRVCGHDPLKALREHEGAFSRIHRVDLPERMVSGVQWRTDAPSPEGSLESDDRDGVRVHAC